MSAINTRNKTNKIESAAIPVGAIVVGVCLFGLIKGLSVVANTALQASKNKSITNNPKNLKSVATIRAETKLLKMTITTDSNLENLKSETFKQLATAPFLVSNQAEIETNILKLDYAKTLTEFKTLHQEIVHKLETGHQQIFTTALLEASQRAALKIGFQKLETLPSPLTSTVRFAATNSLGKTIITEINAPIGRDTRIETEVVGVSDGSCNAILDVFDKALEAEGIRSQPAKRKFTGGVCELSAVRDFLKQKAVPKSTETTETKEFASENETKRRQRLNQTQTRNKQK